MKRFPSLSMADIAARLYVNVATGKCYWIDATKHHRNLVGMEAGCPRASHSGGSYWIIKINSIPYRRSQIVLAVATGRWPDAVVDHINGDKLDDRGPNLRHATVAQNNQNHKRRSKRSLLPMGVRELPSGRFQPRVTGKSLGSFDTPEAAQAAYLRQRKEQFGEYA